VDKHHSSIQNKLDRDLSQKTEDHPSQDSFVNPTSRKIWKPWIEYELAKQD
jgi:hypothetical protein